MLGQAFHGFKTVNDQTTKDRCNWCLSLLEQVVDFVGKRLAVHRKVYFRITYPKDPYRMQPILSPYIWKILYRGFRIMICL